MLKLDNILTIYNDKITPPTLGNNGWALDIYSPTDFKLTPDCNIQILDAGFGLNLPSGIGALITPRNKSPYHFSTTAGQILHPEFDGDLVLNLVYRGRTEDYVRAGDPLCQIVFLRMEQIVND